jgi:hypothetical protein
MEWPFPFAGRIHRKDETKFPATWGRDGAYGEIGQHEYDLVNVQNKVEVKFDPTKPYQTRDGKEAEIFCKDMGGTQPYGGRLKDTAGKWRFVTWSLAGGFFADNHECGLDLVNVSRTVEVEFWVNVYSGGSLGEIQWSRQDADDLSHPGRIDCIHVKKTITEGAGL